MNNPNHSLNDEEILTNSIESFTQFYEKLLVSDEDDGDDCALFAEVHNGEIQTNFLGNLSSGLVACTELHKAITKRFSLLNPVKAKTISAMLGARLIEHASKIPVNSDLPTAEALCRIVSKLAFHSDKRKNNDSILCCYPVEKAVRDNAHLFYVFKDGNSAEITNMLLHLVIDHFSTTYSGEELEKGCRTLEGIASMLRKNSKNSEDST